MHPFVHRLHNKSGAASTNKTMGLIHNSWRYDPMEQIFDMFLFRGQLRGLRLRTADLAHIQPSETVLDVGCGTGTLAIEVQQRVGGAGRVVGIDPGTGADRLCARESCPTQHAN